MDKASDRFCRRTYVGGLRTCGRWRRQDITDILGPHVDIIISHKDAHLATEWLTELTVRMQRAQQALYTARGSLVHEKAKAMATTERKRLKARYPKTQRLYKVW